MNIHIVTLKSIVIVANVNMFRHWNALYHCYLLDVYIAPPPSNWITPLCGTTKTTWESAVLSNFMHFSFLQSFLESLCFHFSVPLVSSVMDLKNVAKTQTLWEKKQIMNIHVSHLLQVGTILYCRAKFWRSRKFVSTVCIKITKRKNI